MKRLPSLVAAFLLAPLAVSAARFDFDNILFTTAQTLLAGDFNADSRVSLADLALLTCAIVMPPSGLYHTPASLHPAPWPPSVG